MVLPIGADSQRPLADVSVFGLQRRNSERNKRSWIVRWAVEGRQRSRSFRTRAEADRFRTGLLVAQQRGEQFDNASGEPESWQPLPSDVGSHVWVRRWLAEQWPEWQPRTRTSAVEALSRLVPLLALPSAPEPPPGLRRHLTATLRPGAEVEDNDEGQWLDRWTFPLGRLTKPMLAEVDLKLALGDDGQALAPSTAGRYRKIAKACIRRAVEIGVLENDPWPPAPRGRARRMSAKTSRAISIRQLPDPAAMREILAAIESHQPASRMYRTMTAVAYYAGLRPSEVVMLRPSALDLPKKGWGRIDVTEADIEFDRSGDPKTGARSVPIPPVLVEVLSSWITTNGIADDELLFRTKNDRRPAASNWSRALHRACRQSENPPMRIYDCRHAAATTWLSAGVPLGEVAKRMGHSVETLVAKYVGALEGDEVLANNRIEQVLSASG
ncbi:MAG TPA: site-specific integrase [Acidimicrobiales bacterium]|nr:site-specific integrase [Acidimicrobiales bacterium]